LAIKERAYGSTHPSVASSLNELGNTASLEGNYDAAEKYFMRMLDIYHRIYGEHHYLLGIALSNLASAYAGKREWTRAEMLYRQAIKVFTETQSAGHVNTAIARIKLGRSLLRQRRYRDAEVESRAGYEILIRQIASGATWLVSARKDLVEEYDALKQPDKAYEFRSELAAAEANRSMLRSGSRPLYQEWAGFVRRQRVNCWEQFEGRFRANTTSHAERNCS